MTLTLVAALVAVVIAHMVLFDRRDKRELADRAAHREEIDRLLQRIQAPDVAVMERQLAHVPADQSGLPMDDTDVAEAEQAELLARIREIEAREPLAWNGQPVDGVTP